MKDFFGKAVSVLLAAGFIVLAANVSNGNISFRRGPEALTSATVKNKGESVSVSGISGNFTVLINKNKMPKGTAEYFAGRADRPADIACHIPKDDKKARTFAENMTDKVTEGDALILLSKAEYGDFDILIFSKKIADKYTAKSLYDKDFTEVVEIKGE